MWAREKIQLPSLKKWQETFTKDPNVHTQVFADAYKVPYGIHFRHNNTVRHYNEYGALMRDEVFAGKKTMADGLREFTARAEQRGGVRLLRPLQGDGRAHQALAASSGCPRWVLPTRGWSASGTRMVPSGCW